jgi:hypothetical protein
MLLLADCPGCNTSGTLTFAGRRMNSGTKYGALRTTKAIVTPRGVTDGANGCGGRCNGSPDDHVCGMIHGTTPLSYRRPGVGQTYRASAMR